MNCATHSNMQAVAYCRTCGKPLCAACTRDVRGTIFCESCLADRLAGIVPLAPTVVPPAPVAPGQTPPGTYNANPYAPGSYPGSYPVNAVAPMAPAMPARSGGPNPTVAGILAGFLPVGVGAVYNGQYAKGLAHLVIFVGTVVALSSNLPWYMDTVLGIGLGFFYFYQIIDAVRSAHAIQAGQPAPDPFGLAQTFSAGDSFDASKVPMGAIVLIGLGLLFLLHTIGVFEFGFGRFWPLILIFIGVWTFARRWGLLGHTSGCSCDRCRAQSITGPAVIFTIGMLFLLSSLNVAGLNKTWPVLILLIGGIKLLQSSASTEGHVQPQPVFPPAIMPPTPPPPMPAAEVSSTPSSEVNRG
jgi:Domain of unknown function (DUF5668)/B-box zinc finger